MYKALFLLTFSLSLAQSCQDFEIFGKCVPVQVGTLGKKLNSEPVFMGSGESNRLQTSLLRFLDPQYEVKLSKKQRRLDRIRRKNELYHTTIEAIEFEKCTFCPSRAHNPEPSIVETVQLESALDFYSLLRDRHVSFRLFANETIIIDDARYWIHYRLGIPTQNLGDVLVNFAVLKKTEPKSPEI